MSVTLPQNSLDLIQRNTEISHHFGPDCFFITARVDMNNGLPTVTIDKDCPTLVNDRSAAKVGAPETMLKLSQGRSEQLVNQRYHALASGAFIWVGDKIALLQRDAKAPALALHWTNPSGMCSEAPLVTSVKELSEEIAFYKDNNKGGMTLIRLYNAGHESPNNEYARQRVPSGDITEEFIRIGSASCREMDDDISVKLVTGSQITTARIAHIHTDPDLNTFVLNRAFQLNAGGIVVPIDAEPFNRKAGFYTLEEALGLAKIVSTTEYYLRNTSAPAPN